MLFLYNAVRDCSEYVKLKNSIDNNKIVAATGLSHISKTVIVNTLCRDTKRRAVLICSDEGEQQRFKEDFSALGIKVITLSSRDFVYKTDAVNSHEYEYDRVGTFKNIIDKNYDVLITTIDGALSFTIPPEVLEQSAFSLKISEEIDLKQLEQKFLSLGYTRCEIVEGKGTFAVRGGIVDVFPPNDQSPVRIEFFGDQIDCIYSFDIVTQRRNTKRQSVDIIPASEVLFKSKEHFLECISNLAKKQSTENAKKTLNNIIQMAQDGIMPKSYDRFLPIAYDRVCSLVDYLDDEMVFLSESVKLKDSARGYYTRLTDDIKIALVAGELTKQTVSFSLNYSQFFNLIGQKNPVFLDAFARGNYDIAVADLVNFNLRQTVSWRGTVSQLVEYLNPILSQHGSAVVLAGAKKAAQSLANELKEYKIDAKFTEDIEQTEKGKVFVLEGGLSSGFEIPETKFCLVVRGQHIASSQLKRRHKSGKTINSLDELKKGDFVVHATHGIGVFEGVNKITTEGVTKDYIKIKYAKQDVLYVPVIQLDLVSKYIGNTDENTIKLNKLGSTEWQNTRKRVKSSLKDIAKELISLYSKRMNTKGYAFSPDCDFQNDFEARFEYQETDDQLACINEIKKDMQSTVPMDRLLCGDVGVGKTEVALRAAFKAIADGKQVVLLVPTTILAFQHYQTAVRRMEGMPVLVEMLSRFRTPKQQTEIIKRVKSGEVDMLIGTHRVLNKNIEFRDLGLVIIDEEQRFGVAQKEKLKQLKPNVDTLTLSATPIPRTLNMAMSGLRDMSSIEQTPQDRSPVQTYVTEYDKDVVLEAIKRELRRSGQVYYLHNKVATIEQCAVRLKQSLPEARISVAHGKMTEEQLSEVWRQLLHHEIDVLVCTTIIETGIDVPNVNTLIIENADCMGLSQLHQLRGRVGRSSRRAYAYLTYKVGKVVNELAQKRLEAIREFTEFGSGFKIAMRDLEIRGAGNVLGGQQHGHMEAVGYDMYIKLLNDAIKEQKGEKLESIDSECVIDLHVEAHIPEKYISSLRSRLGVYRSIADIKSNDDAKDLIDELTDRFGAPPHQVIGLIEVSILRNRAAKLGIVKIEQHGNMLKLYPSQINQRYITELSGQLAKLFSFNAGEKPCYVVRLFSGVTAKQMLEDIINALEKC